MAVRWTPRAERDLLDIEAYIAEDDPVAAERHVERIRTRARDAAATPRIGRRVPETLDDQIREVFVGNYRIIYRVMRTAIDVLTVIEGHRQMAAGDLDER